MNEFLHGDIKVCVQAGHLMLFVKFMENEDFTFISSVDLLEYIGHNAVLKSMCIIDTALTRWTEATVANFGENLTLDDMLKRNEYEKWYMDTISTSGDSYLKPLSDWIHSLRKGGQNHENQKFY